MDRILSHAWWALLIRGILAIVFAVTAIVWPGITLTLLVLMFGAWALVDGVFVVGNGVIYRQGEWGWLVLEGLVGIAAGLIALIAPWMALFAFLMLVGAWLLVTGALEIVQAVQLRRVFDNEWLLILNGSLSILMAALIVLFPGASSFAFVYMLATFAMIWGIFSILLAFRVHSVRKIIRRRHSTQGMGAAPAK